MADTTSVGYVPLPADGGDVGDYDGTGINASFYNPVAAPAHTEGWVFYDSTEKALSYYNDESDVTINMGQELVIRVRNESGGVISNGEVVYSNGVAGAENRPSIALARSDVSATSKVIGIATHDIADSSYGYVTQFGLVRGLNTATFSAGDSVWLSETTAGGLTATEPTDRKST